LPLGVPRKRRDFLLSAARSFDQHGRMSRFIIHGRKPLSGSFRPAGNKNAALPMLAASLLTDEPVTLHNVPRILDVDVMLELLSALGASVRRDGSTVAVHAARLRRRRLDENLCRRIRASILLAGPLAARHGRAVVFPPGGDVIGRRRLDAHFAGLKALGISVEGGEFYTFRCRDLRPADILLDEASVTATENIMMAAALAPGQTVLYHAACEPHVQDLGALLAKMGVQIDGLGTNLLHIHGRERVGGAEHTIGPDYIEAGSFLAAAAATRGSLRVDGVDAFGALRIVGRTLERLGLLWKADPAGLTAAPVRGLSIRRVHGDSVPRIEDGAWPAFPSDLMSVAIVLASQARGSALFFEKMFESRMFFVDRLIEMGARVIQCDPHRVMVQGPALLHGIHMTTPDIRAGMAMLMAALCARGRSVIDNAQVIDRGYENIDQRLRDLGADIVRED
jgi:UDP-N-acetylglucosamine 1-carboxyvinyltransferase